MGDARDQTAAKGDSGFALVAVLGLMVLVASILTPFALTLRTERAALSHRAERHRLGLLAEGVSNIVAWRLTHPFREKGLLSAIAVDSSPRVCAIGQLSIQMRLQGHSGLIDLNVADMATIAMGIEALGIEGASADRLADEIVAYRTADVRQLSERSQADGTMTRRKGAPFESVSELVDVAPSLRDASGASSLIFTVHSKSATIDPGIAPERLRAVLPAETRAARVQAAPSEQNAYAIEIVVKKPGGSIAGISSGHIVSTGSAPQPFRRIEAASRPAAFDDIIETSVDCAQLLGSELVAYLGGAR